MEKIIYILLMFFIITISNVFAKNIMEPGISLSANLGNGSYAEKDNKVYLISGNLESFSGRFNFYLKKTNNLLLLLDTGYIRGNYLGVNINTGNIETRSFTKIPIILKFCNDNFKIKPIFGIGTEYLFYTEFQSVNVYSLFGWILGADIPLDDYSGRSLYFEYRNMNNYYQGLQKEYGFIEFTMGLKAPFLSYLKKTN